MKFTDSPYFSEPPIRDINRALDAVRRICSSKLLVVLLAIDLITNEHYERFGDSDDPADEAVLNASLSEKVPGYDLAIQAESRLVSMLMRAGHDGSSTPLTNIPNITISPPNHPSDGQDLEFA